MLINEILDSPVDFEIAVDDTNELETSSEIDNEIYQFEASRDKNNHWEITFGIYRDEIDDVDMGLTGLGNQNQVFAFVKKSILHLVKQRKPEVMKFFADTDEGKGNRGKAYHALLKRFKIPSYEIKSTPGKNYQMFELVRQG